MSRRPSLSSLSSLSLLSLVLLAAGCRDEPPKETLLIAGSSTVKAYLEPVVAEFLKRNPNANIVIEGGGGTAALIALKRGAIDIATLARAVDAKDDDNYVHDYQFGRDGIAILVGPGSPVTKLTMQQLADIYEGKITNWKAIGLPDSPILACKRDRSARSYRSFNDIVLNGDDPWPGAKNTNSPDEMYSLLKANPNAIGYVSMRNIPKDWIPIKIENIAGGMGGAVTMNRLTVLSGRYPLSRTFYIATYMKASPVAEKFIQFVLSKDGQELLNKEGLIPVY